MPAAAGANYWADFLYYTEHLHPQEILAGPDDFQKLILRVFIPEVVNPVQKPAGYMKHARLLT